MLDAVVSAGLAKGVDAVSRDPAIADARQIGELEAIIGEHGVKSVGHGGNQGLQETRGGWSIGFLVQLDKGELAGPVDRHE